MMPVTIRRKRKYEAEQAIKDLEARGFRVVFELTEFTRDGKQFATDSYKRQIFQNNTFTSVWIAKLIKEEK